MTSFNLSLTLPAQLEKILADVVLEAVLAPIVDLERVDLRVAALLHHLERVLAGIERAGDAAGAQRVSGEVARP
jgi:hypothetical protein